MEGLRLFYLGVGSEEISFETARKVVRVVPGPYVFRYKR
jgi:hypothetical protein